MDTIEVTFIDDDGIEGVDREPSNPLARALASLGETGQPLKGLHACYFDPKPIGIGLRWFGTFVFSAGGRTIYFPGLGQMQLQTQTSRGGGSVEQLQFQVDHLTLERERLSWHLTGVRAKNDRTKRHIGTYATTDVGEGRVLWFGMSIASPDVLRIVKRDTVVEVTTPPTDSRRRTGVVKDAREGVVFNVLQLNEEHGKPMLLSFVRFAVIAGPCGFAPYEGTQHGMPFRSPFVSPSLNPVTEPACRSHRVSLNPYVDVEIITSVLPGRVTAPVTFTSPIKPTTA